MYKEFFVRNCVHYVRKSWTNPGSWVISKIGDNKKRRTQNTKNIQIMTDHEGNRKNLCGSRDPGGPGNS